ncbi:DUF2752 domain-containing protein [Petralouisia muris]|uniref:DUF2752 domain-containing protein n=1 Tax=Petralouisia muris TaxID=3032872 RepID=A0AC61S0B5_9FIRM|nr:DUF2752 domain-containing protein [Petralouisia muris]TGY97779.1 DUF2752 domain-containing protein [Petralouisia muris]
MLILAGLGAVCFWLHVTGIGCPIKWLTGISCAGCGMTRAAVCILRLQLGRAYHYHPLVFLMPVCVLLFLFWEKVPEKAQRELLIMTAACFAVVYLARLYSSDPVVSIAPENGMIVHLWHYLMQRK